MRLRNKKTGVHGEYKVISAGYLIRVKDCNSDEAWQYDCLAGFNEEWEDCEPIEPLIKDEEIISFISMLERIDRKLSKLCGEEE